ncbi:MAG: ATP-binding protein [Leptospiraceae bacterium]|nr:ATP-binding protein [Leptospiraceae bacterium]
MRIILYEECVASSHPSRPPLIRRLLKFFRDHQLYTQLDRYELELVLDEAITNAMEHGNRWDERKSIYVSISEENDFYLIEIRDDGLGFTPRPAQFTKNPEKLETRGRGIHILQSFCRVQWNSLGNEITLFIKKEQTCR